MCVGLHRFCNDLKHPISLSLPPSLLLTVTPHLSPRPSTTTPRPNARYPMYSPIQQPSAPLPPTPMHGMSAAPTPMQHMHHSTPTTHNGMPAVSAPMYQSTPSQSHSMQLQHPAMANQGRMRRASASSILSSAPPSLPARPEPVPQQVRYVGEAWPQQHMPPPQHMLPQHHELQQQVEQQQQQEEWCYGGVCLCVFSCLRLTVPMQRHS